PEDEEENLIDGFSMLGIVGVKPPFPSESQRQGARSAHAAARCQKHQQSRNPGKSATGVIRACRPCGLRHHWKCVVCVHVNSMPIARMAGTAMSQRTVKTERVDRHEAIHPSDRNVLFPLPCTVGPASRA